MMHFITAIEFACSTSRVHLNYQEKFLEFCQTMPDSDGGIVDSSN